MTHKSSQVINPLNDTQNGDDNGVLRSNLIVFIPCVCVATDFVHYLDLNLNLNTGAFTWPFSIMLSCSLSLSKNPHLFDTLLALRNKNKSQVFCKEREEQVAKRPGDRSNLLE